MAKFSYVPAGPDFKPCPFCGAKGEDLQVTSPAIYENALREGNGYAMLSLECEGCGCRIEDFSFQYYKNERQYQIMLSQLKKRWNRRWNDGKND